MGTIRGIFESCVEGVIKRFSASGRASESFADREYMQHYGFTSSPLAGAEAVILNEGNHIIAVASDDRRYRLALTNGEVALYTDEGDSIHLQRGRIMSINTETLEIAAGTKVTITTPDLEISCSTQINMATPALTADCSSGTATIDGNMVVIGNTQQSGNMVLSGTLTDSSGVH